MKRREFITLVGGTAAWPLAARAQQGKRTRRVGVLMNLAADDPEGQTRIASFRQELQQLGWTDGRDVRIDYRWAGDASRFHRYADELLALAPEVILASATPSVQALQQVFFVLIHGEEDHAPSRQFPCDSPRRLKARKPGHSDVQ